MVYQYDQNIPRFPMYRNTLVFRYIGISLTALAFVRPIMQIAKHTLHLWRKYGIILLPLMAVN